jgi:hypothetical protein
MALAGGWRRSGLGSMIALGDMDTPLASQEQTVAAVTRQTLAFEALADQAALLAARLTPPRRTFLEANLVAQSQVMAGLGRWVLGLIEFADKPKRVEADLATAKAGLDVVLAAQQLAARGTWEGWYRGDRKMNIADLMEQTRKAFKDVTTPRCATTN